jgi:hypothetical protein
MQLDIPLVVPRRHRRAAPFACVGYPLRCPASALGLIIRLIGW